MQRVSDYDGNPLELNRASTKNIIHIHIQCILYTGYSQSLNSGSSCLWLWSVSKWGLWEKTGLKIGRKYAVVVLNFYILLLWNLSQIHDINADLLAASVTDGLKK